MSLPVSVLISAPVSVSHVAGPAVSDSVLTGEPKGIAEAIARYRAADAAEALNKLEPALAVRVLEAMPVPFLCRYSTNRSHELRWQFRVAGNIAHYSRPGTA